jgi:hypothetical protein
MVAPGAIKAADACDVNVTKSTSDSAQRMVQQAARRIIDVVAVISGSFLEVIPLQRDVSTDQCEDTSTESFCRGFPRNYLFLTGLRTICRIGTDRARSEFLRLFPVQATDIWYPCRCLKLQVIGRIKTSCQMRRVCAK